jgi:large subunit ribosomal protein L24
MKIQKNDNVIILAGKDKGKKGKVLRVLPESEKVIVEGLNIVKRHQKSRQDGKAGEVFSIPAPIHVSNVSILDPKDKKPTRVGYKIEEGGKKVRIAKRSGQKI